jgi:hypothetical protein
MLRGTELRTMTSLVMHSLEVSSCFMSSIIVGLSINT